MTDYRISADGKKMLVRAGDSFAITDLPAGKLEIKDGPKTANWT